MRCTTAGRRTSSSSCAATSSTSSISRLRPTSSSPSNAVELAEKRKRAHALLAAAAVNALVLRRPGNVAWYSGGGRTHIVAVQDIGVADVVVRPDGDEVVTAVNEAPRLRAEELRQLDARWTVLPWSADRAAALPATEDVATDSGFARARVVAAQLEAARRSLTEPELARYRALGRDAAEAVTDAAFTLEPAHSEHEASARVARELLARAIDPVVLLVAGEQRLPQHRHPLPTSAVLGRLAMIVVCARRHGLIASLTRLVSFDTLTPELADAHARLLRVDLAFNLATRPGARVGDVFTAGAAAYAANGFDGDEWRLHHQGGPTGYEPRDYLADDGADAVVEHAQAFAWNPSVRSLKSEDTIIAGTPPEVLTLDTRWPAQVEDGLARPLVLER